MKRLKQLEYASNKPKRFLSTVRGKLDAGYDKLPTFGVTRAQPRAQPHHEARLHEVQLLRICQQPPCYGQRFS